MSRKTWACLISAFSPRSARIGRTVFSSQAILGNASSSSRSRGWRSGIDVRGRSRTLRVNYRTSHQIRTQADRLLGPEVADVDGNVEERAGTVSVFNGLSPTITVCESHEDEQETVSNWILALSAGGVAPHEFGVFVRSAAEIDRARAAVEATGLPFGILDTRSRRPAARLRWARCIWLRGLSFARSS